MCGYIDSGLLCKYSLFTLLGSFPVVMKEGLNLLGIEVGSTLKPVEPLTKEAREKLRQVLHDMQVL